MHTVRDKGLSKRDVLWRHVLRNAMIPVMRLQFANLLAGTIVIENVFYLPGLRRLIFPVDRQSRPHRGRLVRQIPEQNWVACVRRMRQTPRVPPLSSGVP